MQLDGKVCQRRPTPFFVEISRLRPEECTVDTSIKFKITQAVPLGEVEECLAEDVAWRVGRDDAWRSEVLIPRGLSDIFELEALQRMWNSFQCLREYYRVS